MDLLALGIFQLVAAGASARNVRYAQVLGHPVDLIDRTTPWLCLAGLVLTIGLGVIEVAA